jgi:hypothetical protein
VGFSAAGLAKHPVSVCRKFILLCSECEGFICVICSGLLIKSLIVDYLSVKIEAYKKRLKGASADANHRGAHAVLSTSPFHW